MRIKTILLLTIFLSITFANAIASGEPFAYVSNSANNSISVVDTATNTVTATVNVGGLPFGVESSPDGKKVYVVNYLSNNVSIIDTATNNVTARINVGNLPFGIAVSPDGKKLYVANFASDNISVINTTTNKVSAELNAGKCPWGIALSPDGTKLYSANLNSNITSVVNTNTNVIVAMLKVGNNPWGVVLSPDGKKAFVTNSNSSTVSVINTTENTVEATVNVGKGPWGVAVSPDGKKAYVANSDSNSVSVLDTLTNRVVATVNVGRLPCGVSVNLDGTKVYVVNSDSNNVSIIDTATNTVTASVNVGSLPVGIGKLVASKSSFLPDANFSSSVSNGSAPLSVQFTDLSENATGWNWNFGDGTNSTNQNPMHTYSTAGNYTVTLKASNLYGSDAKSNYVTVSNSVNVPVAAFSASATSGSAPFNVSFTDTSTGSPTYWKWYFGDGTNSTDQNPVHTFSKQGIYAVTLYTSNVEGSGSVTKPGFIIVTSNVNVPIAAFSANSTSGSTPLNVSFTDTSTGSPTSWKWYFGDGTYSTDQNPVHTFSNPGIYAVSLTVSNEGGSSSATKSGYINVLNSVTTPVTIFSANQTSGSAPLNVGFTDTSKGSPTFWKWFFGDGTNSTVQNPVHIFNNQGIFAVTLYTSNAGGSSSATKSSYITVSNRVTTPAAAFSANPTSGSPPLNVSFTDTSTGSPTSWKWYFGDGTYSTDQNPVHTFSNPGIYNVGLTVNNPGGVSSITISRFIIVK